MSAAEKLIEYRNQYKEKVRIFDNEVADLRREIKETTDEIKLKFSKFKDDLLGRLCTDDYFFEMRFGVDDNGVERDYVYIHIGYKDERTIAPCLIEVPLECVDEIQSFEDLKKYADTYFFPNFFDSPSLNERAVQEELERNLQSLYEELRMENYDFEYGDVKY